MQLRHNLQSVGFLRPDNVAIIQHLGKAVNFTYLGLEVDMFFLHRLVGYRVSKVVVLKSQPDRIKQYVIPLQLLTKVAQTVYTRDGTRVLLKWKEMEQRLLIYS